MSDWTGILGFFAVAITIIGTAIKLTWWLGDRLDQITTRQINQLAAHEIRDQERHVENIDRFARLETAIYNGNGKRTRRKS